MVTPVAMEPLLGYHPVSYTHLDVYKRQVNDTAKSETLEPGESAVFKFTVQIYQDVESGFTSESSPFTVSLNYAQKIVTK